MSCCNCIYTFPGCYNICEPIALELSGIPDGFHFVSGDYFTFQATAEDGVLTIPANVLNESDCAVLRIDGYSLEADGKVYDCIKIATKYQVLIQAGGIAPTPEPPVDNFCDRVNACISGGSGTTQILVPNYLTFPNLDPVTPQTLQDGDIVIHGGFQWQNTSGSPVTPTVVDEFTLSGLTQMARTLANGYFAFDAYLETAAAVGEPNLTTRVRVPIINHLFEIGFLTQNSNYLDPFTTMIGYVFGGNVNLAYASDIGMPKGVISNNLGAMVEIREAEIKLNGGGGNLKRIGGFASFVGNDISGLVEEIKGGNYTGNEISGKLSRVTANSNFVCDSNVVDGAIDGISAIAGVSEMIGNHVGSDASINSNVFNSARMNGNVISGGIGTAVPQIAFCVLNDNCEVRDNVLSGDGAVIWDVNALENSGVYENTLSGSNSRISAIKMNDFDEIYNNTLADDAAFIANVLMMGYSKIHGNVLSATTAINNGNMGASEIRNCTFSGGKDISNFELKGSIIENASNIRIRRIHLRGARWDLAGYTTDILHHYYDFGKGHFAVDSKQGANPIGIGIPQNSSVFLNIIPKGHRVTKVYLQGDNITGGAGAHLEISCDGEVIASHPLSDYNDADGVVAPNGGPFSIGKVLTANHPIALTARNNNITGGNFVLVVEYVKGE